DRHAAKHRRFPSLWRSALRSDRPTHRPALAVPRCLRLPPESVRHLTSGGFASPTRHSIADARRGHRSDLAILLSPSACEWLLYPLEAISNPSAATVRIKNRDIPVI